MRNRKLYPSDWKTISLATRARAGGKCEECGAPNGAIILRGRRDSSRYLIYDPENHSYRTPSGNPMQHADLHGGFDIEGKHVRVVLTVHHKGIPKPDGSPGDRNDKHDNRPENLAVLCQRCHLRADTDLRVLHSRRTKFNKKHRFQIPLPIDP